MESGQLKRVLTLTDVVLFNVVVVFSVRGMTTAARIGPASILLWLLAVAAFFVPLGLAAATFLHSGPATHWSWGGGARSLGDLRAVAYFGTLSFALVGLELAPVMGGEIRDPERALPRALLISGGAIAALYIVGTLAIMVS